MIRFILRFTDHDDSIGLHVTEHFTLDAGVPALERELQRGGVDRSAGRFTRCELVGAEIIAENAEPKGEGSDG